MKNINIEISDKNRTEVRKYTSLVSCVNELIKQLTPNERLNILEEYCKSCGIYDANYKCQCWNDE